MVESRMGNSSHISTKPPSGTRDFLPADIARRRHVVNTVEQVYQQYGFVALETPAFENLTTLLGKYGDEGDQLLYRLLLRRDALSRALAEPAVTEANLADQGLRYDLTVPLARVVAQYRNLPRYFKRYQIQPVWRADRPGRGRFREFIQCDVDIVGTSSLIAEAEVCAAAAQVLRKLGFDDFAILLNHRQLLRGLIHASRMDPALEATALVAVDKLDKVGADGVLTELHERGVDQASAARLMDLIERPATLDDHALIERLQQSIDSAVGQEALAQLIELRQLLASTPAGDHVSIVPSLARGLSYYTGAIFEVAVGDLAGSLGGGGRYDDLIGMFGRHPIPAVGFSLGLERLLLVMEERGMYPALSTGPELLLCWVGIAPGQVLDVAHKLRAQGLRVEVYPDASKLGKQLQYADSAGVKTPFAAIIGDAELADGKITLRHLASSEQKTVPLDGVRAYVDGVVAGCTTD